MSFFKYRYVAVTIALSSIFIDKAIAQTTGAGSTSCEAGLLSRFASGFVNAFEAVGLSEAATDVCFLNQLVLAFIGIVMAVAVVYGVVMVSRENDIKTAFWPLFTAFFTFVLIGIISKVVYQTPV